MARVSVERYVEQVLNGTEYKGHIKIGGTTFDYELRFGFPIAQLDDMEPSEDVNEIRRRFQITVRRDNADINLTTEEYGFFFSMIVELAVNFYNNPQAQATNEGPFGKAIRGEGPLADFGVTGSIGMTSNGTYDFPSDLCEILNSRKFGCALVV